MLCGIIVEFSELDSDVWLGIGLEASKKLLNALKIKTKAIIWSIKVFFFCAKFFYHRKLLGWLYKSFLRNLHEEQRKQLIEPLRPKFVQKLKNESYICKKCGNAFTPAQNEVCYSHQYETAKKCNDFEDNVSLKVTFFKR